MALQHRGIVSIAASWHCGHCSIVVLWALQHRGIVGIAASWYCGHRGIVALQHRGIVCIAASWHCEHRKWHQFSQFLDSALWQCSVLVRCFVKDLSDSHLMSPLHRLNPRQHNAHILTQNTHTHVDRFRYRECSMN